jgi:hypothetical protein
MLVWKAMPSMTLMMSAIFLRAVVDALHRVDHLPDHLAALHSHGRRAQRQLVGLARVVGVLLDGGAELFHRRRGLLQRTGLLLGAAAQVVVALGDLRRGGGHAVVSLVAM